MMKIEGKLISGLNRGAKFLALDIYRRIFTDELGAEPFCGTLNLEISESDAEFVKKSFTEGKVYDNLQYNGKVYGGIILLHGVLYTEGKKQPCVLVRPLKTSHSYQTVEIVASICFRDKWGVNDGDILELKLE